MNHSIAYNNRFNVILPVGRGRRHQQALSDVADDLPLIFGILVGRSRHIAVTQCWRQRWRHICYVQLYGLVFVVQIGEVKVFVVCAFWSAVGWGENEKNENSIVRQFENNKKKIDHEESSKPFEAQSIETKNELRRNVLELLLIHSQNTVAHIKLRIWLIEINFLVADVSSFSCHLTSNSRASLHTHHRCRHTLT